MPARMQVRTLLVETIPAPLVLSQTPLATEEDIGLEALNLDYALLRFVRSRSAA